MFTRIVRGQNKKERKNERKEEVRCNYNLSLFVEVKPALLKKHC